MEGVAALVWSTRRALQAPASTARRALGWAALVVAVAVVAVAAQSFVTASLLAAAAPALAVGLALVCRRAPLLVMFGLATLGGMFATVQVELNIPVYMTMATLILGMGLAGLPGALAGAGADRPRLWFGPPAVALLVAIGLAYVALSYNPGFTIKVFRQTWWFLMIAPIICFLPFDGLSRRLAKVIVLAALVAGGYALLRWGIGPSAAESGYAHRVGRTYTAFAGDLRLLGGAGDAHGLSSVMVPLVPFCAAIALGWHGAWRLAGFLAFSTCTLTLVLTDVRSGLVCAALGVVLVLVLTLGAQGLRARRILAAGLGLALAVGMGFAVVSTQASGHSVRAERFRNILQPERDASVKERLFIWSDALREIDERPFGHGFGSAGPDGRTQERYSTQTTRDVVSTYLRIAYEQGIWVAVLFALLLIALVLALARESLVQPSGLRAMLALGGAGAALAYAIELGFESIYLEIGSGALAWIVIGLGMRQVTRRPRTAALPAAGPR